MNEKRVIFNEVEIVIPKRFNRCLLVIRLITSHLYMVDKENPLNYILQTLFAKNSKSSYFLFFYILNWGHKENFM